jgi:hypothetical protein
MFLLSVDTFTDPKWLSLLNLFPEPLISTPDTLILPLLSLLRK